MPDKPDDLLDDLRESLEGLRSKIVDLEATAHAAAEAMNQLPYLPQRSRPQESKQTWTEEGTRNLGRMQSLVYATASAAESLLDEIKELIADAYSDPGPDRGPSDSGGPSGGPSGAPGGNGARNSPKDDRGQPPSKPAPAHDHDQSPSKPAPAHDYDQPPNKASLARDHAQPHGPNGHGLRMPGGIVLDMRPIPLRPR
jgi:hypothetical protein